jgi:hypothetical protein
LNDDLSLPILNKGPRLSELAQLVTPVHQTDLEWRYLAPNEDGVGRGYEFTQGNYRARYETCLCTAENALRNRKWTVWHEGDGRSHVVASGFCYGSAKAEAMIFKAIELGL